MKKILPLFTFISLLVSLFLITTVAAATTPTTDTTPPTHPEMNRIYAGDITQTSIKLNWTAATDNVGVVAYDLYKSNQRDPKTGKIPPPTLVATFSPDVLTYTLTGLQPGTWYNAYFVYARDAAGNVDGIYSSVGARTNPISTDTTPIPLLAYKEHYIEILFDGTVIPIDKETYDREVNTLDKGIGRMEHIFD